MKCFEEIIVEPIPGRIEKPRNEGLTMVIDNGLGMNEAETLCAIAGDYIDFIKIGFGTSRLISKHLMKQKIQVYSHFNIDIYPGGTLLEIAHVQNVLEKFLVKAKEIGFTAIEVSDGTVKMNRASKDRIIEAARLLGFKVLSEVGKKDKSKDLSIAGYSEEILTDIHAGAFKVIIEARESGRGIGIYNDEGNVKEDMIHALRKLDLKKLLFEAPLKHQQVYLIKKFGSNVNLGNIYPAHVLALEALRRGLRSDTLRLIGVCN